MMPHCPTASCHCSLGLQDFVTTDHLSEFVSKTPLQQVADSMQQQQDACVAGCCPQFIISPGPSPGRVLVTPRTGVIMHKGVHVPSGWFLTQVCVQGQVRVAVALVDAREERRAG